MKSVPFAWKGLEPVGKFIPPLGLSFAEDHSQERPPVDGKYERHRATVQEVDIGWLGATVFTLPAELRALFPVRVRGRLYRGDWLVYCKPPFGDANSRLLSHVLPPGYVRIRHYGLLASTHRRARSRRSRSRGSHLC